MPEQQVYSHVAYSASLNLLQLSNNVKVINIYACTTGVGTYSRLRRARLKIFDHAHISLKPHPFFCTNKVVWRGRQRFLTRSYCNCNCKSTRTYMYFVTIREFFSDSLVRPMLLLNYLLIDCIFADFELSGY